MNKTERMVTWGLLALIAYELWVPAAAPAQDRGFAPNSSSDLPTWLQNLSYVEQKNYESQVDTGASFDTINNLLAIPQGPGGTPTSVNVDYFNPMGGLLAMCDQPAPQQTVLRPFSMAQA